MRFHVDADLGTEVSLWIAPDHPDQVPQISIWEGQHHLTVMEANVLREDVRQLGMHSTGQVGFSITSEAVTDIEQMTDLTIYVYDENSTVNKGLEVYRRAADLLNRGQRLLVLDTGAGFSDLDWGKVTGQYAQKYPSLDHFNMETLLSILGNELAPSIAAVGFPYLSRVRNILDSLDYKIAMMFHDPIFDLARQIDHKIEFGNTSSESTNKTKGTEINRRNLMAILRNISELDLFEMSNPVMRKLVKAPGEQVSPKDLTNALRQMAKFDLVVTDQARDALVIHSQSTSLGLPPVTGRTERQCQIAENLRHIGIATDMISEDLALYDLSSAAIIRACTKLTARSVEREDL